MVLSLPGSLDSKKWKSEREQFNEKQEIKGKVLRIKNHQRNFQSSCNNN